MIPDINLQLNAVLKSLKDNVLPAVDPDNELAQQQLQLSLATLDMVLTNLPYLHRILRQDIAQHLNMAQAMLELGLPDQTASSLQQIQAQASETLNSPEHGLAELQVIAREIRSRIGDIIGETSGHDQIDHVVLQYSEKSLMLGRAMNKPAGFEPAPEDLLPLAELLT